jgi:hypothetical protein
MTISARQQQTKSPNPTLEDLQPLYQAVAHGCLAGMHQQSLDEVYVGRISRGDNFYSTRKLGAVSSNLGATASFFEQPWSHVSPTVTERDQGWLLNEAAQNLVSLGWLTEALEPMRAGLEAAVAEQAWNNAARSAISLGQLEISLGDVAAAAGSADRAVALAGAV